MSFDFVLDPLFWGCVGNAVIAIAAYFKKNN